MDDLRGGQPSTYPGLGIRVETHSHITHTHTPSLLNAPSDDSAMMNTCDDSPGRSRPETGSLSAGARPDHRSQ